MIYAEDIADVRWFEDQPGHRRIIVEFSDGKLVIIKPTEGLRELPMDSQRIVRAHEAAQKFLMSQEEENK